MKEQGSKKKAVKILSLLLAVSFFLDTQGFTVFAETISGNEGTKDWEQGNISEVDYNEVEEGNSQSAGVDGSVKEDDSKENSKWQPQDEDSTEEKMVSSGVSKNAVWEGEESPANPTHHCTKKEDGTDYTDWSYVYFGSYPQSEVTDSVTIEVIDKAISKYGIVADVGMDVWVNGIKYRRISKGDTYYDGNFGNNTYRYFKWERIRWRVLKNDGNTLFVVADRAIDGNEYNAKENSLWENYSWANCTIRNWLNNSFYNTAFNSIEQEDIVTQNVIHKEFGGWTRSEMSTIDKVYLLAVDEVRNEEYGFCSGSNDSVSRKMKASDYAHIRGVWRRTGSKEKDVCNWWLRSRPYYNREEAIVVDSGVVYFYIPVYDVYCGICPVLHINLPSSSSWSMEDDGSSGEYSAVEKAARPEASIPTGSSVPKNTKLSLSCATVGADIYYTTDGTIPTIESSLYKGEITLDRNMTVKAVAMCLGYQVSDAAEFSYKVQESSSEAEAVKVSKLSVSAPSKKLAAGKKVNLTLGVTPENASNKAVTWKTSNKKYATVDKNGKVTLKKAGAGKSVTITATANDGSGKKASIKIKIMKHAVKSIKLKAPAKTLKAGKSMSIKATVKTTGKSVNKTLKWQSSNTKYATVNQKGKVTAKKAGKGETVTITAISTDGSNKEAKVKVKIK